MKPVILWSDVLIFILVISLTAFIVQLRKSPQARERWRSVFTNKVGLVSFVVILFYVSVALLDSLHFRTALPSNGDDPQQATAYSNEVQSVLDLALSNLHASNEKTYSAPFAIHSFVKENLEAEDGSIYRDYARLEHAGQHLESEADRAGDILWRSLVAIMTGLLIAAALIALHKFVLRRGGDSDIPWNAAYVTIAILSAMACWVIQLSEVYHVMGTNKVGADVMYSSIKAIRTGVLIGTLATMVTLPFAIILGISAGYFKGLVDDIVQYIYTTLSSIPSILLIAASVLLIDVYIETHAEDFNLTILRSDFKFLALCAILGLTSWTTLCRLLRAETLKVSQLEYVQAAHAFGVSHSNIITRHILPNITHIILITLVLDFSMFVLAEALLSYIGVGVDPSMHSWGNMINAARSELSRDPFVWWPVISAFLLMFTLVLAANLFSDEVRNAFDPRTVKEGN
jgi:peptide/nickel transport system permease protein